MLAMAAAAQVPATGNRFVYQHLAPGVVTASADFGSVANDDCRAPNEPHFVKLLTVDFMGSIALENVAP